MELLVGGQQRRWRLRLCYDIRDRRTTLTRYVVGELRYAALSLPRCHANVVLLAEALRHGDHMLAYSGRLARRMLTYWLYEDARVYRC